MRSFRSAPTAIAVLALVLVIGACASAEPAETTTAISATSTTSPHQSTTSMDMGEGDHEHEHEHGKQEWDGGDVPSLSLSVVPDSSSGVNVFADVSGFRFAPENASADHVPGEGHAHIEVDGVKVARVYGPAFHLGGVEPGTYEVSYVLAANTHDIYTNDGEPLSVTATVVVPEPDDTGHSHGESELREWDGSAQPEVTVSVVKDPKAGWNLIAEVSGFELTPQAVGGEHVPGEGHAHIYVDGRKLARVYASAFHIEELPAGELTIEYRLSGNDHVEYDVAGSTTITVSEEDGVAPADEMSGEGHATEVTIEDGAPVGGPVTIEAEMGSEVHFTVVSDAAEQVHVHGYDLFFDVAPGAPATVMFIADVPGVFEVELEGSHTLIVELIVS